MSVRDAFRRGFSRVAAKSPFHQPAVIYRAETDAGGVVIYDDQGQMVFREVERTHAFRDLPSEDRLGIWQGEYTDGTSHAGAVTLSVLTSTLLDHGFLIGMTDPLGPTLFHVMAVKSGDVAGVMVKVLGKPVMAPMPRLLHPNEAWPPVPDPIPDPIPDPVGP